MLPQRQPVFRTGRRQYVSTAGSPEPFFRDLTEDARAALPTLAPACVLRGKRRSRTPCPPPCRMTMRRGALHGSLRSRLRRAARPLSAGCGVSRRMGRVWIETWNGIICAGSRFSPDKKAGGGPQGRLRLPGAFQGGGERSRLISFSRQARQVSGPVRQGWKWPGPLRPWCGKSGRRRCRFAEWCG